MSDSIDTLVVAFGFVPFVCVARSFVRFAFVGWVSVVVVPSAVSRSRFPVVKCWQLGWLVGWLSRAVSSGARPAPVSAGASSRRPVGW